MAMQREQTRILALDEGIAEAVRLLGAGRPVAVPTETVYGLAADATNGAAVAAIYEAKGRPQFNPLIIHAADRAMAARVGVIDGVAARLADAFWPGPLTLVVPLRPDAGIHPLALAGLSTVALRVPRGPMTRLIAALGRPLAAPSANRSGALSPTDAHSVADSLAGRIPLVLDGGPASVGVESTIVGMIGSALTLLRPGGVAAEEIEAVAGMPLARIQGGEVIAPGMLLSHYAPDAALRLNVSDVRAGEALLGFGPHRAAGSPAAFLNLSTGGDVVEAAQNLFSHLRALDASGARAIAVEPVPMHGLGEAVNDRLARAAAPRGRA